MRGSEWVRLMSGTFQKKVVLTVQFSVVQGLNLQQRGSFLQKTTTIIKITTQNATQDTEVEERNSMLLLLQRGTQQATCGHVRAHKDSRRRRSGGRPLHVSVTLLTPISSKCLCDACAHAVRAAIYKCFRISLWVFLTKVINSVIQQDPTELFIIIQQNYIFFFS